MCTQHYIVGYPTEYTQHAHKNNKIEGKFPGERCYVDNGLVQECSIFQCQEINQKCHEGTKGYKLLVHLVSI